MDVIEISSDEEDSVLTVKSAEEKKNHTPKKQNDLRSVDQKPVKRIKLQPCKETKENCGPHTPKKEIKEDCGPRTSKEDITSVTPKKLVEAGSSRESNSEIDVAFEKFISTILRRENTDSMHRIVEKKLRKYYNLAKPEFRSSGSFLKLINTKVSHVDEMPQKLYLHIQEVVDELKSHGSQSQKAKCSDHHIKKLCRAANLVLAKIKKLEEKEVDFDDEEDSSYIILQKYRARLIQIHNKILELEGNKPNAYKRKISVTVCQFPVVNKTIERYVNTKGQFPDFQDVLELVKKVYEDECLTVSQEAIYAEAKTAFISIGEQLQKLRKTEIWEAQSAFVEDGQNPDPAEQSVELKAMLEENKKVYGTRIDECINHYAELHSKRKAQKKEEDVKEEEESGGDEEEDEEEEEEEEENADSDVIIEELEKDAADDTPGQKDIFSYCGPVSPPTPGEGCSRSLYSDVQEALGHSSEEPDSSSSSSVTQDNSSPASHSNSDDEKIAPKKHVKTTLKAKRFKSFKSPKTSCDDVIVIDDD